MKSHQGSALVAPMRLKSLHLALSHPGLATTLMDATTDKDPLVQEQIYNALCYLGESEPEEILNSCDEYLRQHDKVGPCSAPFCCLWGAGSGRGGFGLPGGWD